jgi:hypothetical protein
MLTKRKLGRTHMMERIDRVQTKLFLEYYTPFGMAVLSLFARYTLSMKKTKMERLRSIIGSNAAKGLLEDLKALERSYKEGG